ncbi:MAG: hypothetical protein ACPGYV_07535 [Phycisphaeraceae bacterium]
MKRLFPAVLCAAGLLAASPLAPVAAQDADEAPAPAVPQPDAVTHDWQLQFEHSTPTTIAIEQADGTVQWYWYMTYKVTNLSDDDIFFDPRITIQSDNGDIVTANLGVSSAVFNQVRNLLEQPLLLSPVEVPARVFKGEDFARESAAIWKVSDEDIDRFKVFFGGIYGETKTVTDPNTGKPIMVPVIDAITGEPKTDADGNPLMQPLELKRTRMIHYATPGTTESRQDPSIKLVEETDVLR